jgi:hypothetical protein
MATSTVRLASAPNININRLQLSGEATEERLLADVQRTKAVYLASSDLYKPYAREDFQIALDAFSRVMVHQRLR